MATQKTVYSHTLYDYEQEHITEIRQVAGDDGVVREEEVTLQDHFHFWITVEFQQKNYDSITYSNEDYRNSAYGILRYYVHAISNSTDFTIQNYNYTSSNTAMKVKGDNFLFNTADTVYKGYASDDAPSTKYPASVSAGEEISYLQWYINSQFSYASHTSVMPYFYFDADGKAELSYYADVRTQIKGITGGLFEGVSADSFKQIKVTTDGYQTINLEPFNRGAAINTATSFTDEENPTINYAQPIVYGTGVCYPDITGANYTGKDTLISTQAAISLDGTTPLIGYKNIDGTAGSFTFNLTEAERELLRVNTQGSDITSVYFIIKTEIKYVDSWSSSKTKDVVFYSTVQRNLTIIGCNPQLNPTVVDIKEETLALTGDENTFIRYESMAEYAINAVASKHATIVSQSVTCGSKTIEGLPYGVIEDVESGTFNFYVADSRNMGASSSVFKNFVEYVKPTCYQKLEIELSGETGANIGLTVNGNYYNGSFGAVDNTLLLEVRFTDDDGNMGEWTTLTETPTFNGNTYKLQATFGGFNYGNAYIFQCRATDKLNFVQSSQYTIRLMPVFDWSETDFNFNVPINMNGKTVLRHNATANNTVLSASGGHIYIRPGGTDDTSGETIIYPDGRIKFGGEVTFADGTNSSGTGNLDNYYTKEEVDNLISEAPTDAADYIVETGTASMGSNGTWYWTKWNSGKAECYGVRNYGNMAITAIWGDVYASVDVFTQTLPANLFNATPDYINISFHHANNGSGWIINTSSSQPSATATGSFKVAAPASVTAQATHIGFNIIGRWK